MGWRIATGRRPWIIALILAAVVTGASACSSRAPTGRAPLVDGASVPVTKVTDGDTIHVTYEGSDERVRFIGINTPEVDWYGGAAQCYGSQAGLYTRSRLDGRSVTLVFDVAKRDRYGRLLAYVYVGTELLNLTLVRLGYATADPVPPDTRMAPTFKVAEGAAHDAGRGLWAACPT